MGRDQKSEDGNHYESLLIHLVFWELDRKPSSVQKYVFVNNALK